MIFSVPKGELQSTHTDGMGAGQSHSSYSDNHIVHGIQYLPGRIRKSKRKQLHRNLTSLSLRHYDQTDEVSSTPSIEEDRWLGYDYPFENVVLSGGGSKGYAYVGALKALEDCGALQRVKRIAGSSAGAICGALLAVGCTPQEIADIWAGDNYYVKWVFHDQECLCCCCLPKLWKQFGVHASHRFYDIYGEQIKRKVGNPDITFEELYKDFGRELCIVVTNLSKMRSEYCHPKTTPDLPIRMAVRMSMSFPIFFEPVRYDVNGQGTCLYSDGGTLDQYPIHCFDGPDLEFNHNVQSEKGSFNEKTLGLYLVSESAIDYKIWQCVFGIDIPSTPTYLPDSKLGRMRLKEEMKRRKRQKKNASTKELKTGLNMRDPETEELIHYNVCNKEKVDIKNFGEYFITTIETLLISQRRLHIKPIDVNRTVAVNCGYIGTSDYVIEPADREFLIRQGYAHVQNFLDKFVRKKRQEQEKEKEDVSITALEESTPPESPDREGSVALSHLSSIETQV